MTPEHDPRLDFIVARLRDRVGAAGLPQHKHSEIGQFIELLEGAAGAALGVKGKLRVSQWHSRLKSVNGAIFKQLEAAYGLRNVGTHLNPEQSYLDDETVRDELRTVERVLPWVVHGFRQDFDMDFIAQILLEAERTGWTSARDSSSSGNRPARLLGLAIVAAVAAASVVAFQPELQSLVGMNPLAGAVIEMPRGDAPAPGVRVIVGPAEEPSAAPQRAEQSGQSEDAGVRRSAGSESAAVGEVPSTAAEDASSGDGENTDTLADAVGGRAAVIQHLFDALEDFGAGPPAAQSDGQPGSHRWAETRLLEAEAYMAEPSAPQPKERRIVAQARLAILERCCSTAPMRDCMRSPLKLCLDAAVEATNAVGHPELQDGSAQQAKLALRLAQELERPVRVAAARGRPGVSQPSGLHVMPRSWAPAEAKRKALDWAKSRRRGVRWGSAHWFVRMPAPLVLWRRAVDQALTLAESQRGGVRGEAVDVAWRAMATWVTVRYVMQPSTERYLAIRGRMSLTRLAPAPDDDVAVFRVLERRAATQATAKAASSMVAGLDCVLNGRNCSSP
ncbi:MAG: hypothetical protein KC502_08930 [Myxococcales bacterium]|nr:hypothetical protein [Myxococcales bacterium]